MNLYAFLKQLGQIPSGGGDGVRVTKSVNTITDLRTTAGLVLTAATTPAVLASETNALSVVAVASSNVCGSFIFNVPKDYDKVSDELKINVLAVSGGTTDHPTLTCTAYRKRPGAALSAALTVVVSATIPSSTSNAGEVTINLSGNALQGGDVLTINLVSAAHTTDTVVIDRVEMQYKSAIVFNDPTIR